MIAVNQKELLTAIKAVKSSCGRGDINPILNSIRVKTIGQGIELTATDLTNTARTVIEANVTKDFDVCINADKLENIVSVLENNITIENVDTTATFKSGKAHFDVLILNSKDYPEGLDFDLTGDKVILKKEDFIKGVNQTVIATANEVQSVLNGVCFTFTPNGYEIAATDGNRLAIVNFDDVGSKDASYVIPHRALINVSKVAENEVEIYFTDKRAIFKTGNYLYSTVLYVSNFPKYNQLVPQNAPLNAEVDKSALLKALDRVAIMSDDRTNITTFDFKDGELHLTTSCEEGKSEDTIPIDFNGEIKLAFNYKFILEGLRVMQSDKVTFKMNQPQSATLLQGDFTYLCMPIVVRK